MEFCAYADHLNLSDYFSQIANHNMWGAPYFLKIQDYPL
jgi:hypothetical protein